MSAPAHEHEFEAALGLPEQLPSGERILWQGAPDWRTLAVRVMHVRTLSVYFAVMLLWRSGTVMYDGGNMLDALQSIALLLPLAVLALGMLSLLAWLTARTTVYTLTNRRVVMRIGIVLSITFNLPYRMIESASLRPGSQDTGDIALVLAASDNIAYANLWPHARPWRVRRTEPMLRAIPDAARVGQLLAAAITEASPETRALAQPLQARQSASASDLSSHHQGGALPA